MSMGTVPYPGAEFETESTLREIVDWIEKIIREGLIRDMKIQPILPTPQNSHGKTMIANGLRFSENDWPFNLNEISRRYI